ncbi:MAG: ABC transporter ATP-binding protein, partial [Acidobacteria bacterium]|nr:ABC transporter ATP-binding protein [Acidobacteriota bacterium]
EPNDAASAPALAENIRRRFHEQAAVLDNTVRIERENGHRFVTEVVEAFPGQIRSVSISKPTLEDVFIRRTGHRFWVEEEAAARE